MRDARTFHADDRAIGYQLVVALIFLGFVGLVVTFLLQPVTMLVDFNNEIADGTEYESYGDSITRMAWDAFAASPVVSVFLAFTFVVVSAIVLSANAM